MTIKEALETAEIEMLDAEILLCHVLQCSREFLIAHNKEEIPKNQHQVFQELCARRIHNEPVSYITGVKEFYGKNFAVTPDVLIPRPATEGLIDLALDFLQTGKEEVRDIDTDVIAIAVPLGDVLSTKAIIDVGTGSGCIAITLKSKRPDLEVYGVDISAEAIDLAKKNAETSVVKIYNSQSSYLDIAKDVTTPFIVVSNPPYIPNDEVLMKDVKEFEPGIALFSGEDGGDHVREILKQAQQHELCVGVVIECKKEHQKLFENLVQ